MIRTLLTVLLFTSTSFAGWLSSLNVGMNNRKVNNSKYEATYVDLTHGFANNGLYFGGLYGTGSGTNTFSHFGASIGWVGSEWHLMAHYLLGGDYTLGGTDYKEGTGTQIDIGHISNITSSFHLGVQMSSRSMTYKDDGGGADLKISELYPSVKLTFIW